MKTLFTLIAAVFIIAACSNDDDKANNNTVVGRWHLTETLLDPGDGSGTFEPTESSREITFYEDGTYMSNSEAFCSFMFEFGLQPTTGNYTGTTIICDDVNLPYTLSNGSLIISYMCDEPCKAKYERME